MAAQEWAPPIALFLTSKILEASSLSESEILALRVAWEISKAKEFRCHECVASNIEATRQAKGCFGSARPLYTLGDFKLSTCLGNLYSPTASAVTSVYAFFKQGVMITQGSFFDQPAAFIEAMSLLSSLEAEDMRQERERAERKQKNG